MNCPEYRPDTPDETVPCPACAGETGKTTARSEEERKKLINRLNRIEGQVRGLKGMIEKDAYCADLLTQAAAIGAALDGFRRDLLSRHVHSCVVRDIRAGDDAVVDELMVLLGQMMK